MGSLIVHGILVVVLSAISGVIVDKVGERMKERHKGKIEKRADLDYGMNNDSTCRHSCQGSTYKRKGLSGGLKPDTLKSVSGLVQTIKRQ